MNVTAASQAEPQSSALSDLDHALHAMAASMTHGLSPVSLTLAYLDWLVHLFTSPGKQLALVAEAHSLFHGLTRRVAGAGTMASPPDAEFRVDQRFDAPAWRQWPFNVLVQAFLSCEQWWNAASTGIPGVTPHHQHLVNFGARQWLDMLAPSNFFCTNPQALHAAVREGGASIARGALHLLQDTASAGGQVVDRAFRPGVQVAATPGKVVLRNRLIELIQYSPTTRTVRPEPVLIVPSWILKFYILDLSPGNSLVRYLVDRGYTVVMLSWRNPDACDRELDMDDYLRLGPRAALATVQGIVPQRRVHGVGYCLGGTLLAIAAATWAREDADALASLTLLASMAEFVEPGDLGFFIDHGQVSYLEDLMWQQGYLDGRQMSGSFTLLNARELLWGRMVRAYLLGERSRPSDLAAWSRDVTRLPYRMHSAYLRSLYLDNALAHGNYMVDGCPVALSDLRLPIFAVGTSKDHISPWRSVYKLHLLTDAEITFVLTSGGHNAGIVSEPGHAGRSYRMAVRSTGHRYVDPDRWLANAEAHEGSWRGASGRWLGQRSGRRIPAGPRGASGSGAR